MSAVLKIKMVAFILCMGGIFSQHGRNAPHTHESAFSFARASAIMRIMRFVFMRVTCVCMCGTRVRIMRFAVRGGWVAVWGSVAKLRIMRLCSVCGGVKNRV